MLAALKAAEAFLELDESLMLTEPAGAEALR